MAATSESVAGTGGAYRRPSWLGFGALSLALGALACSVLVIGLAQGRSDALGSPAVLAAWLALVVVGDLLAVPLWGHVKFSLSLPALLAAGMVLTPFATVLLGFLGFFDKREWSGDFRLDRGVANRAQVALSAGAASLVFHGLGGDLNRWPSVLVPAFLALVVDCAVNATVVVAGASLLYSRRIATVARGLLVGSLAEFLVVYLCFGALGLLMANSYLHIGVWGLLVGMAPMFLAAEMLRRERRLVATSAALEERNALLQFASEQAILERTDERNRIASAIHDDVLQSLHYLMLHAQVIREDLRHGRLLQLEEDVPVLLRASQQTADLARSVVRGLRGSPLGREGLGPTLVLLVAELRDQFEGEILTDVEAVSGSSKTQTFVYQVGREALVNAVRHSGASRVSLHLSQLGSIILLRVGDNGEGFEVAAGSPAGHFGLSLMRERVSAAGGSISIKSELHRGTEIEVLFPSESGEAGGESS